MNCHISRANSILARTGCYLAQALPIHISLSASTGLWRVPLGPELMRISRNHPREKTSRNLRKDKHTPRRSFSAWIVLTLVILIAPAQNSAADLPCPALLDQKFANLMDEPVSLCQFSGKALLVVNTASECGYTPQYDGLEKLYRRYRDKGFVVLGFPANDFGAQEPGSNKEIAQFCQINYGITFPVFAKTTVVGAKANPLFRDLVARTGKPPL